MWRQEAKTDEHHSNLFSIFPFSPLLLITVGIDPCPNSQPVMKRLQFAISSLYLSGALISLWPWPFHSLNLN